MTQDGEHSSLHPSISSRVKPPPGQGLFSLRFLRSQEKILESDLAWERQRLPITLRPRGPVSLTTP